MSDTDTFYSDNRWNNLHAYAQALEDMVAAGADPVENVLVTLSLALEQFPECPPVDPESHHVACVHSLLRACLGALRKGRLDQARAGRDVPAPENPSRRPPRS
ncbi:MAG: hypothetical protein AB7D57_05085 [Desulfovibrionaceae bacterium]